MLTVQSAGVPSPVTCFDLQVVIQAMLPFPSLVLHIPATIFATGNTNKVNLHRDRSNSKCDQFDEIAWIIALHGN
jgi:hypothetical protein